MATMVIGNHLKDWRFDKLEDCILKLSPSLKVGIGYRGKFIINCNNKK